MAPELLAALQQQALMQQMQAQAAQQRAAAAPAFPWPYPMPQMAAPAAAPAMMLDPNMLAALLGQRPAAATAGVPAAEEDEAADELAEELSAVRAQLAASRAEVAAMRESLAALQAAVAPLAGVTQQVAQLGGVVGQLVQAVAALVQQQQQATRPAPPSRPVAQPEPIQVIHPPAAEAVPPLPASAYQEPLQPLPGALSGETREGPLIRVAAP